MDEKADDVRAWVEQINDVLKREPGVKSFLGACAILEPMKSRRLLKLLQF